MADIVINPVTRRVQFTGNTGTGPFAFTFNILSNTDIAVYKNTTLLTLTTDYTVSINVNGTGSVTLTGSGNGTPLISSDILTIIGGRELSRVTDFVTAGDLLASSLNTDLDSLTVMAQQLDEKIDRSLKASAGDSDADLEIPLKANRLGRVLGFNATTGNPEAGPLLSDVSSLADITADIALLADIQDGTIATNAITIVSGISSNVSTVAGISSDVTAVSGNTTNINTVSSNLTGTNTIGAVASDIANVNTVAGISSSISTVASNTANINAVAADATDIGTVATNISSVNSVSSNVTNINTVAGLSSDISAVVLDAADIGTVASNISNVNTVAGISGNITTVAGISSDVTAVAADATDIGTVAGNLTGSNTIGTVAGSITNVNNVGGSIANVNTVATNITDVVTFATTYLGAFASAPTTTVTGALYYNTSVGQLYVWDGAAWDAAAFTASGAVTSFNTRTGAVTLSSADVTGALTYTPVDPAGDTMTGDLSFGDNNKAIFGTGSDLQIYHDGSNSFIDDAGTGNLLLRGSLEVKLQKYTGENMIKAIADGAVELNYDNAVKLATTSSGIDVTGTVTSDGLTVDTSDPVLRLTDSDTGETATVKTSGAGHLILDASQANAAGNGNVYVRTQASTLRALFNYNGDISFYDSTGTSQNLFWDASASKLGIGTTSPDNKLIVNGGLGATGGGSYGAGNVAGAYLSYEGGNEARLLARSVGTASSLSFWTSTTSSSVQRMTITSAGLVGISTSSPADKLHVDAGNLRFTRSLGSTGEYARIVSYNSAAPTNPATNIRFLRDVAAYGNDGAIAFDTRNSERMRLTDAGLLVGKTSADFGVSVGMEMRDNDTLYVTRDGGASLNLNRKTSDGNILLFQQDGATTGQIATYGSDLVIGTGNTGVRFVDASTSIQPTNSSTGSRVDNSIDLGAGTYRFKDLYLSGGVYLGGTAASNLIDAYEEGDWTPALYNSSGSSVSVGTASGKYTKIGNMITIWMYLYNVSASFQYITGHPAANSTSLHQGVGSILAAPGGAFSAPLSTGPKAIALVQGNTQLKMDGNYFSGGQNIWLTMNYRAP